MGMGKRAGLTACLFAIGCAATPPLDNPVLVRPAPEAIENPVLVSPGVPTADAYREVFEKTVDILDDYFDLLPPDPYDGRIVTKPRIAPGYEQFWKPGNPDPRGRLLATFQTIRQTASAEIRAGNAAATWFTSSWSANSRTSLGRRRRASATRSSRTRHQSIASSTW